MKRAMILLASALLVSSMLSGCIVVPAWDDGGYGYGGGYGGYGGGHGYHHRHGYDRW